MKELLHILLVEDDESDAELLSRHLRISGFQAEIVRVETEEAFLHALARPPDLVLSDFALPRFGGRRALELTFERTSEIPFIIVSGTIGEDVAVQLMKGGAADIVQKERLERLGPAIVQALHGARLQRERTRSAKALAESEARYRSLVEQASDGIFMITPEGACLEANRRAAEIFGHSREQLLAANLWQLMEKEKRTRVGNELARMLDGSSRMSDWRIRRGDGSMADVEVSARLLEDGKILAIVRDQTERKRTEAALREEQERFSTVAAMAPGVLHSIHMSKDGSISLLYVSPRVHDLFGIDPAAITRAADRLVEQWHPDDRKRVMQSIFESRRTLSPWRDEFRVVHPEKGVLWIEGRSMPVPEQDGGVTWHGVLTDITDRKHAEAVLEERLDLEERLSRLADSAPGVMYVVKQRPGERWGVSYLSRQSEDVLGLDAAEIARDLESGLARIPAEDLNEIDAALERSKIDLAPYVVPFRYHHPSKGPVWLEARSTPLREGDGTMVWYGFLLDVTQRIALEEQLRQSQKMEAFGQLASGVAHDFNNLLTIIQGNASMLPESDPEGQAACAEEILHAAQRASSLTRQLLVFSRRQPMKSVELDLSDVVGRMAKMLKPILGEDIVLGTDLPLGVVHVCADPGMMEQIVLNLAVNARDAMPRGGSLSISAKLSTFDDTDRPRTPDARAGTFVCLTVSDTGSGIPPEIRARIFEPFFTTKEVGKGTGLGLATVHGIVKQHRGFIDVQNGKERGAVFHVYLPVSARRPSDVTPKRESLVMPSGHETILVVEDELSVRTFVTRVLKRCGYSVVTAASGHAALEAWKQRQGKIDLLLTDMVMPDGMTGREVAEHLTDECASLKVVYTSGFSADWGEKGVILTEGVNFLQKPYEPHKLAQTVRDILDRKPAEAAQGAFS